MKKILYFLADAFFLILAKLPKSLLYLISDFLYIIIFYLVRYRKKTTLKNLKNSFPDKTKKEMRQIIKKFYHHLCDITIENAALIKMSKKKIASYAQFMNPEILTEYYNNNRNIIMVFGHYANWEFLSLLPLYTKYPFLPVYKTVNNNYINDRFYKMRSLFGSIPVKMENTLKLTLKYHKSNQAMILGLVADQRPRRKNIQYWTNFLNQETPVFTGAEKIGKRIDAAIIFIDISKEKRGLYKIEFSTLCENSTKTKEFEITELFIRKLENQIRKNPEYWLWSHNRWKHKRFI